MISSKNQFNPFDLWKFEAQTPFLRNKFMA